jgi:hypothetical protein
MIGDYLLVGWLLAFAIAYLVLRDAKSYDWSRRIVKPLGWGFLVLVFWPAFLPLYVVRRPRDAPAGWYADVRKEAPYRYWDGKAWTSETSPVQGSPSDATKTCPECAEGVKVAALKCRFCGHTFAARVG